MIVDNTTAQPTKDHIVIGLKAIAGELAILLPMVKSVPNVPPQVVLGVNLLEAALAMVNHALGN